MALVRNVAGVNLLEGCCHEAERAERVALALQNLRQGIPQEMHPHLDGLINQIFSTSYNLRDIADQSQVHMARVSEAADSLNVLLPCLMRTLQDIEVYYSNQAESRANRWRRMYQEMKEEVRGTPLPARFSIYNDYLNQLRFLLGRSPLFAPNALIHLRYRILDMRKAMDIPPPHRIEHLALPWHDPPDVEMRPHWAEFIFKPRLPTKTILEGSIGSQSEAFGPWQRLGQPVISSNAKILETRHFNNRHITVIFVLQDNEAPYVMIRTVSRSAHWVCVYGAHELCIARHDDATLCFTRWSNSEQRGKRLAILKFDLYEELVLFYNMFLCLKLKSILMVNFHPRELTLKEEDKLFSTLIVDVDSRYRLAILEDSYTKRRRLQISVHEGHLRGCPVWTTFLPGNIDSPRSSWLKQKSDNVIWLRGLHPYVFCDGFSVPTTQPNGKTLVLCFVYPEVIERFIRML
ncbi:hypothetical protein BJ166DRAFT_66072 [Pestalotiopsis sp. NC0098]|nr:hypothetical protein BJ166DRAFT_66072 [Pestalotiopsis sp. NC0098]